MTAHEIAKAITTHANDPVLWLGTVSPSARPTIRPVWFVVDEKRFVLFSTPNSAKVEHVARNPHVVLTFHTDPRAQNVRVINGLAEVDSGGSAASETPPGFLNKYEDLYPLIGYTRASFDATLSTRIVIVPTRTWGW